MTNRSRPGPLVRGRDGRRRALIAGGAAAVAMVAFTAGGQAAPAPSGPTVLSAQLSDDKTVLAGEAWTVVDPARPGNLGVVWLETGDAKHPTPIETGYCGWSRSSDGGHTWSAPQHLPFATNTAGVPDVVVASSTVPICGDPVAGVGPDGTFYVGASKVGSEQLMQGLASTDDGRTWKAPTEIFGVDQLAAAAVANVGSAKTPAIGMGRAFMAVDPLTGQVSVQSQEDGGVEGRWITVSNDHGATWSAPRPLDPDIQSKTAGPQSAAGGLIGVAYDVDPTSPFYVASPRPAVTCASVCTVFETTADGGVTWTRHVTPVRDVDAATVFPGSLKITAADPAHLGHFALVALAGSASELQVWTTPDKGRSWTRAHTFAAPPGQTIAKPWVAYSRTGALGLVWHDVHADGRADVVATVSRDDGATFGPVVALTDPRSPVPPDPGVGPGDDCACNLVLDATSVYATWADSRTGQRQIYFGRFDYARPAAGGPTGSRGPRVTSAAPAARTRPPTASLAATGVPAVLGVTAFVLLVLSAVLRRRSARTSVSRC